MVCLYFIGLFFPFIFSLSLPFHIHLPAPNLHPPIPVKGLVPNYVREINARGWTLSFEIQSYALFMWVTPGRSTNITRLCELRQVAQPASLGLWVMPGRPTSITASLCLSVTPNCSTYITRLVSYATNCSTYITRLVNYAKTFLCGLWTHSSSMFSMLNVCHVW